MKQQIQKILSVILIVGCASCSQFRDSIHDTLYGTQRTTPANSSSSSTAGRIMESGSDTVRIEFSTSSSSTTVTHSITSSSGIASPGFLGNSSRLKAAELSLRKLPAFSRKQIYLYRFIHFYDDGRINVQLQNPENPEYVDEYSYRKGSWETPKPVQLSVHDNIKKSLVKLDDVDFENAGKIYRHYSAKANNVTGAPPLTHVYAVFDNNTISWYPQSISGSRERYFISFEPNGDLKSFYRQ